MEVWDIRVRVYGSQLAHKSPTRLVTMHSGFDDVV